MPSGYGQRLPFYFPFLPSYWRPPSAGVAPTAKSIGAAAGGSTGAADPALAAPRGSGSGVAVSVRHLTKDFPNSDGSVKRAVDDLTLNVATQQVTAVLGEPHLQQLFCLPP